jgi:hypothetical protein
MVVSLALPFMVDELMLFSCSKSEAGAVIVARGQDNVTMMMTVIWRGWPKNIFRRDDDKCGA